MCVCCYIIETISRRDGGKRQGQIGRGKSEIDISEWKLGNAELLESTRAKSRARWRYIEREIYIYI